MKTITVKCEGIRPILMSNPQTVDIENEYSAASRAFNSKLKKARKKEDESMLVQLSREQKFNDFCASAYFNAKEGLFYIPDTTMLAAIREAAKAQKKAKDIDRSVLIEDTEIFLGGIPRVKSLEDAYENPSFRFGCPAKIPPRTGALVWKMRCMMPTGWTCEFQLTFDDETITLQTMKEILEQAGKFIGVGGWRPKFGRFLVTIS